ncbi:MAG: thioredoxin family protein [Thermoplasmatota archaeon]
MDWPDKPVELTDATFEGFTKRYRVTVVDFWGPTCAPCKMMAPLLDQLAAEMKGQVVFGKLDVTKNMKTSMSMGIRSIPTFSFYRDGILLKSKVGFIPKSRMMMEIREIL